jgi:hypothetical protein
MTGLAGHTGSTVLRVAAGVFYLALVRAWLLVAIRTARGAYRGQLFLPASGAAPQCGDPLRSDQRRFSSFA